MINIFSVSAMKLQTSDNNKAAAENEHFTVKQQILYTHFKQANRRSNHPAAALIWFTFMAEGLSFLNYYDHNLCFYVLNIVNATIQFR